MPKTLLFRQVEGLHAPGLSEALSLSGSKALSVHCEAELLRLVDCLSPDCHVLLMAPELKSSTAQLVEQIRLIDHRCPLLILTSPISKEDAICAMRAGVSDLLDLDAPADQISAALRGLAHHNEESWPRQNSHGPLIAGELMVGSSLSAVRIRNQIARVAATDANVLVTGESGTGKELVAELIHRNSRRSAHRFVAVNCAAVPDALLESELFGHRRGAFTGADTGRDGKLQHASGGTLFLDEIGDMSLIAQAKILRAVESRVVQKLGSNADTPVDVRLVAATNQDLDVLTREKKFRQDLYFRLNVVRLALPPLRERSDDIPELAEHVVRELSERQKAPVRRIESDVIRRLQSYDWPGNVRELRNVLESILVFSSSRSIGLSDVPAHIRKTWRSNTAGYGDERSRVLTALSSADWNRNKAAKILCCSRMTLYRKMAKYSIPPERL
jgi:DNA-binding NtrC family response regulator